MQQLYYDSSLSINNSSIEKEHLEISHKFILLLYVAYLLSAFNITAVLLYAHEYISCLQILSLK